MSADTLNRAFVELESEVPPRVAKWLRWLRAPRRGWVRIPAGVLLTIGGLLWFLPVLGFYMLPLGLALLAIDIPFLRRPMGAMILWLVAKWRKWRGKTNRSAKSAR